MMHGGATFCRVALHTAHCAPVGFTLRACTHGAFAGVNGAQATSVQSIVPAFPRFEARPRPCSPT